MGHDSKQSVATHAHGNVMVLGHNFDSEEGYRESFVNQGEDLNCQTWRYLLELLHCAGIQPKDCFFTNAYMGLIVGDSNTGKFPGADDLGFVQRCQSFLAEQITVQKPRVILALGIHVPKFIAPLSPHLAAWKRCKTFKQLDASGFPLINSVHFNGSSEQPVAVVALTHPCLRKVNVRLRRYRGLTGEDAELAMLREAFKRPGLQGL